MFINCPSLPPGGQFINISVRSFDENVKLKERRVIGIKLEDDLKNRYGKI